MKIAINVPAVTKCNYDAIRNQLRIVLTRILDYERIGRIDKASTLSKYFINVYLAIYEHREKGNVSDCIIDKLRCGLSDIYKTLKILPRDLEIDVSILFNELTQINIGLGLMEVIDEDVTNLPPLQIT